jgi:stage II sporulation protein M
MYNGPLLRALTVSVLCFVVAAALGGIVVLQDPTVGERLVEMIGREIGTQIMDDESWIVAVKLFINNLQVSMILFAGGATFGVLTCVILLSNGLLVGGVIELVRQQQGLVYAAAAILPHGIFEVPAILTAGALGIHLGVLLWHELHGRGDAAAGALVLARIFGAVVIPFLAVAAFIEAFITPEIINLVI